MGLEDEHADDGDGSRQRGWNCPDEKNGLSIISEQLHSGFLRVSDEWKECQSSTESDWDDKPICDKVDC